MRAGSVAGVLVLWMVVILGPKLWLFAVSSNALPQWDMAKYGVSGLRLADAVRQLDPLGWLQEIHGLSTWPPVWPLVESVAFLVFGGEVSVARGLVVVCWMLAVVAASWALRPLPGGNASGILAAAWVAQAPLLQALATVNLLEVPGVLVLLLSLGCAFRALDPEAESRRRAAWWRATWISSLVLFFLKYNYGLLWLVPLLLAELVRRQGGWRPFAEWSRGKAVAVRWTPSTVFVAVFLVLLAAIRLSGGVDMEILGRQVRATSVGNPAYALLVLVCLRTLLGGPSAWRRLRLGWRRLDESWHGLATCLMAPILAWMLLPPHVKEFFGFVENRSSGLGLVESLALYPRILLHQYSATPWLGALVCLVALFGLRRLVSVDARLRLLALVTLTAWLALLAHPYKLPRFMAQAAVLTGVLASVDWMPARRRAATSDGDGNKNALRALVLGLALFGFSLFGYVMYGIVGFSVAPTFVETQHELRTVPRDSSEAADAAADLAADGGVILGTWNELSPALVEWRARRLHDLDAGWRPTTTLDLTRRSDPQAVIRALAATSCRPVGFVASEAPGWRSENAWMDDVVEALRSDPCRRPEEVHRELTVFACPQGIDSEACQSR